MVNLFKDALSRKARYIGGRSWHEAVMSE